MAKQLSDIQPGDLWGDYRIDRELGRGSFSRSFLVTDINNDTAYVLKLIQPDGESLEQHLAEGLQLQSLNHPGLARVERTFEYEGVACLLMAWQPGEALHHLLERSGTFSVEEARALGRPLAEALAYLHQRNVFHQDVKPANVWITQSGMPILLDLGTGKRRIGTEGYGAPEQFERGEIGAWTDVYGLAATLHRCLTGKIPPNTTLRKQGMEKGLVDPMALPAEILNADPQLADAIEKALKLKPLDRTRDMATFKRTLTGAMATPEVEVETEGREWLPLILVGVLGVLLISAVIYLFTGDGPSESQEASQSVASDKFELPPPGSPEETRRWEAALAADTVFAYRLFLDDFPESTHKDQANRHIQRLDSEAWSAAALEDTRAAIEGYLEDFPEGLHQADAQIALDRIMDRETEALKEQQDLQAADDQAWETARKAASIAAMDTYLQNWPLGAHVDAARSLRRQITSEANDRAAFAVARKSHSIEAYRDYLAAFPQGVMAAQAMQAIDDLILRPGKMFKDCADCPTMIVVPSGSFWQGSEDGSEMALKMEQPRRMVTIGEPFAVGVFEITMQQWDLCVSDGTCSNRPRDNGWGRDQRPVIMVSWNDTQEFTQWLSQKTGQSYSLPSESQWEYVARAGEESDWFEGDPSLLCEYANIAGGESGFRWQHEHCADAAALETLPVGSLKANAFGLHDVIGNVAEWTNDCMNLSYLDAPADGSAWGRGICSSRMTRGGSWFTGTREVRLPARFNLKNGDRNDFTGFRVVRKVEAQ